ncbi:unnamed protein product [Merluccius merluccius]
METLLLRQLYTSDESRVIQDAVDAAIRAVLDAVHGVHRGKLVRYQGVVADRDREIGRLRRRLRRSEAALRDARGQRDGGEEGDGGKEGGGGGGRCEAPGGEDEGGRGSAVQTDFPSVSAERPPSLPDRCVVDDDVDDNNAAAAYSSHDPSDNQERSWSSSPWGPTDGIADSPVGRYTPHAAGAVVKEEPSGCEAFFIKLEMCEQSCGSSHQDDLHHPDLPNQSPTQRRRLSDAERNKRYRQRCRSTPEGLRACREKERLRYLKRRVLVAEMSEDARRRKREMWRAAARRHRDRKMSAPLPHCPPAGADLFDEWPESPTRELDRCARRGAHCQEPRDRDVR